MHLLNAHEEVPDEEVIPSRSANAGAQKIKDRDSLRESADNPKISKLASFEELGEHPKTAGENQRKRNKVSKESISNLDMLKNSSGKPNEPESPSNPDRALNNFF